MDKIVPFSWLAEDFRMKRGVKGVGHQGALEQKQPGNPLFPARRRPNDVRVCVWNLHCGYELVGIIEELRAIDADILLLQECDVGTRRTNGVNVPKEIAQALKLNMFWACEIQILSGGGQGNAILTKFDLRNAVPLPHRHQGIDLFKHGHKCNWWTGSLLNPWAVGGVKRVGGRCAAVADVVVPATGRQPQRIIRCYTDHFEMHRGMEIRLKQMADLLEDEQASGSQCSILGGDFNTCADGFIKCVPKLWDNMTWKSLGVISESKLWADYIFGAPAPLDTTVEDDGEEAPQRSFNAGLPRAVQARVGEGEDDENPNALSEGEADDAPGDAKAAYARRSGNGEDDDEDDDDEPDALAALTRWRQKSGKEAGRRRQLSRSEPAPVWPERVKPALPMSIFRLLPKPLRDGTSLQFTEAFDVQQHTCGDLRGFVKMKLDWCLSKGLSVTNRWLGNHNLSLSDHKYLVVDYR